MKYIGTKIVHATAMTRLAYNTLRGWTVPADENPQDPGYLVEYQDGGAPNVPGFAGYVSWSPKEQFEAAYRLTSGVPFGLAMEALKLGKAIARTGWNGHGMFVYLVAANAYPATSRIAQAHFGDQLVPYNAYMALRGADGRVSTWAPSGSDSLADDWIILDIVDVFMGDQPGAASQVDASMGLPSKTVEQHAAETMDHDQLGKLGQMLAKVVTPAPSSTTPAPSVPEERINVMLASLTYETAHVPNTNSTVATARLPGGFVVVVGHDACVSAANFNADLGRQYAIEDATLKARSKLWEFEGYVLALQLAGIIPMAQHRSAAEQLARDGRPPHQVRVFVEHWELQDKIEKLRAFRGTGMFATLPGTEQGRLTRQQEAMQQYSDILAERIAAF